MSLNEKNTLWRKKEVETKRDEMRKRIDQLALEWRGQQPATSDKALAGTSPAPVVMSAQGTEGVAVAEPTNQAGEPSVPSAGTPSSPSRAQSTEAGEVESMLRPSEAPRETTPRKSPLPRASPQRFPSMEVDVTFYEPEPTADSIMNPRDLSPPHTFHAIGAFSSPSSPLSNPSEHNWSYDNLPSLDETPKATGSTSRLKELQYPLQIDPTLARTPRHNGRNIPQSDSEEDDSNVDKLSRSPPIHRNMSHQMKKSRQISDATEDGSPEMVTETMPPRSRGVLPRPSSPTPRAVRSLPAPPKMLVPETPKGKEKADPATTTTASASDSDDSSIMILSPPKKSVSSSSIPRPPPGRTTSASSSSKGSSQTGSPSKKRDPRGKSHSSSQHPDVFEYFPIDGVSEVRGGVFRAGDNTSSLPTGSSSSAAKTLEAKVVPAKRIR